MNGCRKLNVTGKIFHAEIVFTLEILIKYVIWSVVYKLLLRKVFSNTYQDYIYKKAYK